LVNGQNTLPSQRPVFWQISSKTGICPIPEKVAAKWPIRADNEHYMGLNLGLFLKTGLYNCSEILGGESGRDMGFFLVWKLLGVVNLYDYLPDLPMVRKHFPEKEIVG